MKISCCHNMQVAHFFQNFFENLQIGQNKNVHFLFWNTFYKKKLKKCHFCKSKHNAQNRIFRAQIFVTIQFEGYLKVFNWYDFPIYDGKQKSREKAGWWMVLIWWHHNALMNEPNKNNVVTININGKYGKQKSRRRWLGLACKL